MELITINRMTLNDLLWKKRLAAARYLDIHPNTLTRRLRSTGEDWRVKELNHLAEFLEVDIGEILDIKAV